ncbi:DUF736 family protein [Phenylobacterium sp.]|uniref:DUF736 domain-containing protein n=1 Tax=Phenylobacterium sp. TaxID=1871053 RepID=UPI0025F54AC7|nr:DUF736 family protein [Phenylobacterium sp.]
MTTIGTFSQAEDGSFHGAIRTLTLNVKAVTIRPIERTGDKAPDHRVLAGPTDIGAAWTVTRPGKPPCLSVRIDEPSLPAPLNALLVEANGAHQLRWSRRP